jgi:Zn-dependent protease
LRNTIPIGRIFGIRIGLHRTLAWLVGGIVLFVSLTDPVLVIPALLYVVGVFSLVLLHELGHSMAARHFDIQVPEITLSPLGGVAWMEEIPEDSRIEGLIAIAGPLVNLGLALLATPLLLAGPVAPVAIGFILINLMLGCFNLIPAFPMDGGRVLRALLALRCDWLTATERAVRIGRAIAIVGGIVGFLKGFILVPFLAVYVIMMGQRELLSMRARKLGTSSPFGAFAEAARRAQEQYARRSAETPGGFQNPAGFAQAPAPQAQEQGTPSDTLGFTDKDIEKLEGFHGRLPRDWRGQD